MTTRRFRRHLCSVLFLCFFHPKPYEAFRFQDSSVKSKALLTLAQKTVYAIRDKDTAFISANIDEKGVFVGIDSDRMSAAEFRRQLSAKTGVYCVIFDPACLPQNNGSAAKSLRDLVLGKEVSMALHQIKDEPGFEAVDVKSETSSSPLFTLMYRYTGKAWKLEQIEYL